MLNLKKLLTGFVILFLASLVGIPAASFFFTAPIKIGGDLYQNIAHKNEILASIMPPDVYLIEAEYMVVQTMVQVYKNPGSTTLTDEKDVKRLIAETPRIEQEYKLAYDRYISSPLTAPELLKDLETSDKHVQRYLSLLNTQFFPALSRGDTAKIVATFDLMSESFVVHREAIEAMLAKIRANIEKNEQQAESVKNQVILSVTLFSSGLVLLILIILFMAYKVSLKPLMQMAREIYEGTEQSRMASSQLTEASQKLAQGASEQAAAIEETSASLEEVSSMIHSTAKNAEQAKQLATQTRESAQEGVRSMAAMTTAMADIERSSSDVAKIVKSIDEIAFQTNILALNAAVEAARAGEAGAGFAVVADEVRSLAQRSAMAAHESAEKIEASIRNSRMGAVSLERVHESLGQIEVKIGKTDALVAEISLAAREQAQGIEHVSVAIEQMSKVAQDTADSASQIAHAAEQTHSQSMSVEDLVEQGIQVVGFSIRRQDRAPSTRPTPKVTPLKQRSERVSASAAKTHRAHAQNHLGYGDKPQLHAPEPTSEQHFKDF